MSSRGLDHDLRQNIARELDGPNSKMRVYGPDLPVTKARPRGCWVISSKIARPRLHLVDRAVAAWKNGRPYYGASGKCGIQLMHPVFPIEPPDYAELCDQCVLRDIQPLPVVYRFFDASGQLLYIGCTVNFLNRIVNHTSHSRYADSWWPLVARFESVEFRTLNEALNAEELAIRIERPLFNTKHRGRRLRHPDRMKLIAALAVTGAAS